MSTNSITLLLAVRVVGSKLGLRNPPNFFGCEALKHPSIYLKKHGK